MKKIRYIMMIAGFAALGCSQPNTIQTLNEFEDADACRELISWIKQDVENNYLDGEIAETYIWNLEAIIERNEK